MQDHPLARLIVFVVLLPVVLPVVACDSLRTDPVSLDAGVAADGGSPERAPAPVSTPDSAAPVADGGAPAADSAAAPSTDGALAGDLASGQTGDAAPSIPGGDGPAQPPVTTAPGTVLWQQTLYGSVAGAALDRDSNIVVGASTNPRADRDFALARYTQDGTRLWLKEYGGPTDQNLNNLTQAPDGSLLVTGEFSGMTDFGGQSRTPDTSEDEDNRDMFLAAYTAEGMLTRVLTFGGPGAEAGSAVLVDQPSGDWFVTGWGGPLMAGGQTLSGNFLIRVSPTGEVRWARRAGMALVSLPNGGDLVSGGYVAGQQLNRHRRADGTAVWVKDLGAGAQIDEITVDRSGNLVTTAAFSGSVSFGNQSFTSQGDRDAALVVFSSASGEVLWSKVLLASKGSDGALAICLDAAGDILVAGTYGGSPAFQPGEAAATDPIGFVAKYSSDGTTTRWIKPLAFTGYVFGLLCDAPGGTIVTYNGGLAKLAP